MKLIIITAIIAVCHTAKLDRTYLPPPSAATAGGNHNSLQTPLIKTTDQVAPPSNTPLGSFTNEFEGVVVDAAAPGTRASSDNDLSGLGAPRPSYGSTHSKVGDAAFRESLFRGQGNPGGSDLERPQASKDRNSNILSYSNDVNPDAYSYGFETDNGIAVGENGIAADGIQAEGGYSYQGDDGQTYKVTYVADEKGYRPQGAHLPTPPPIPVEILKSLEQNAQEEAAGVVDDGSYDAQKYNDDYTHNGDIAHNGPQLSQFGNRPESDASASGSFINQNNQALGTNRFGSHTTQGQVNQENQFGPNTQHHGQGFSQSQDSQNQAMFTGQNNGQFGHHTNKHQFGLTNNFNGHTSQFGASAQSTRPSGSQFGTQAQYTQSSGSPVSQFGSQTQSTQPSESQFGTETQYTQSSGSSVSQFGSQTQSTQPSESQFGTEAQYTQSSGSSVSQFGSQMQSVQPTESQFGTQSQHSHPSGTQFGAQTQYTQSSGTPGSQFGSQIQSTHLSGSQFGNHAQGTRPSGSQFGSQDQSSHHSGLQFGAHVQSTHPFRPQFGNQPQFGLQSNIQTKPQPESLKPTDAAASSSFSQSSVTPSPGSGNQFTGENSNKPFNAFGSNQVSTQNQLNKFGASSSHNINRFPQIPNRFGANNEYLPPLNNIGSKPQFGTVNTFNNGQHQNRPNQSSQTQEFQQSSAIATSLKPNNFQSQTPSRPSQFSGNFQSSQNQQFNSQFNPSQSPLNSQTISNSKPTSIPDTELTTPLEPNEISTTSQSEYNSQTTTNFGSSTPSFSGSKPNGGSFTSNLGSSAPNFINSTPDSGIPTSSLGGPTSNFGSTFGSSTSTVGGSKPNFGSSTSSFNGFNKQPSNQLGHSQQLNTQGNIGSSSQNFPSTAPTPGPQTSSSQFGGSFNKQSNNGKPQFQQNYFSQNQFNQKPDDSYYYNRPTKPFDTPQGSRFPSLPSYQSNVGQNSQFGSQQNSFTKVPGTPVPSTSANQFNQNQGSLTNFNGITQAAISPFPSISPTTSTQFGTTQNNQFDSKPTYSQTSSSQSQAFTNQHSTSLPSRPQRPTVPQSQTTANGLSNSQTDSPHEPTVPNQQYEGTIYEYNKPAETLPSTHSDSDSSQTIQSNIVSSKPEENKPTTPQINPKPTQVSQFGQNSFQQSQQPNFNLGMSRPQYGSQANNVPNQFGQTTQFGSQVSSQQQSSQATTPLATGSSQTNFGQGPIGLAQQPLGTTGSGYLGYPSAQDSKPQFGSNFGEISQFPTVVHSQSNFNSLGQKPNVQTLESDSQPFPNMAIPSVVPSPPKQFLPQTSAQAAVSSEPLDFLPLNKPQNQYNQPSSPQPVKSTQPSQIGSQFSSFQSSSGKGEEFGGPRPPPSFDDKTGYHY